MIYASKGTNNQIVYAVPVGFKFPTVIAMEVSDPTAAYVDYVNQTLVTLPKRDPPHSKYLDDAARIVCDRIVALRDGMPDGANCEITRIREGKREKVRVTDTADQVRIVVLNTVSYAPPVERQGRLEAVVDRTHRKLFKNFHLHL